MPPSLVAIEYRNTGDVYAPASFPAPVPVEERRQTRAPGSWPSGMSALERARRYLDAVPPAIAGEHGDLHTFRVCCRLVRGFGLDDTDALTVLAGWNARCQPPWSEQELLAKIARARTYGREPVRGLLGVAISRAESATARGHDRRR